MIKYSRSIRLIYILILFLFGNQIFANNLKAYLICEGNAGPDTLICGYEYILPSVGNWEPLCPDNGALVSFENLNFPQNPVFKVSECGKYEIVFHDDNGTCKDTAIISFENPDHRTIRTDFEIDLELEIDCLGPASGCGNSLTIDGATFPQLNWDFCVTQFCEKYLHTTSPKGLIDDCLYDQIDILVDSVSTDDFACSDALLTGDNLISTLDELIQNSTVDCTLGPRCFPLPPPSFILDTTYLNIPVLAGGQWHYFAIDNALVPLQDSTHIVIEEKEYLLVIEPGSDYYGPDEIVFTIFEMGSMGEYVPNSTNVDLQIQYVLEYRYELVEFIFYKVDNDSDASCPNTIIEPGSINIPLGPPNPCPPILLSFQADKIIETEIGFLDCNQHQVLIETCPGEFTSFYIPGEYFFSCMDENGCAFEKRIEIHEDVEAPYIDNISYECDPGNETYSAEFSVSTSSTIIVINGFETNNNFKVSGVPSCTPLNGYALNLDNGCLTFFDLYHCCSCINTQSSIDAVLCEGETFEILGQTYIESGNYEILTTNSAGCDSLIRLSLEMLPATNINIAEQICEGDSFEILGQTYTETGDYEILTTNSVGCDSLISLSLEMLPVTNNNIAEQICEGESIEILGQLYTESGDYEILTTNSIGCDSLIRLSLEMLPVTNSNVAEQICEGESIEILGQSFTESGNYEILTTNSVGCDSLIRLSLETLPVTNINIAEQICEGAEFVFFDQILNEPGEYIHFEVNNDGCQEQHTLNLEVFKIDDVLLTEYICEGETYEFFGQELGETGTYTSSQQDAIGCLYEVILLLEVTPIPEHFESVSICEGSSIEIGGEHISTAGTFSVVDYDNTTCGEIFTYDVSILESSFNSISITLCEGDDLPLSNSTIHAEGVYMDTLTNAIGCDSIIQIDLKIDTIDFEMVTIPSCRDDETGSIQITSIQDGAAPFTFSLDGANFTNDDFFENLSAGSYSVQVIDRNLCEDTKQITIEESPEIIIEIQDAYELTCEEPSLNLALNVDESTEVVWSTGNSSNEIIIDEVGAYAVTLSNLCQDKRIEFIVEEAEDDNSDLVYIPNAFSPNQDAINDEFKIYYATPPIEFQLEVFDRWGNKLFHTNDPNIGWNGFYRNEDMQTGVYVYKLETVINSCIGIPKSIFKKGDVTLIK